MPQGTAALRLFCGASAILRRSGYFAALRLFCGVSAFSRRFGFLKRSGVSLLFQLQV
jgi:hypothetical protein